MTPDRLDEVRADHAEGYKSYRGTVTRQEVMLADIRQLLKELETLTLERDEAMRTLDAWKNAAEVWEQNFRRGSGSYSGMNFVTNRDGTIR